MPCLRGLAFSAVLIGGLGAAAGGCSRPPAPPLPRTSPASPPSLVASKVRTIDPADHDWTDLEPLAAIVGDARVVALGEPSHLDGSAFLAKSRVVEYLHERLHFDVLAWEAGVWGCEQVGAALADPKTSVPDRRDCIGWPWGDVAETTAILSYARESSSSSEPLRVTGFDVQLSGRETVERFASWLTELARRQLADGGVLLERVRAAFGRFPKRKKFLPLAPETREGDRESFRELRSRLASAPNRTNVNHADLDLADRAIAGVIALYDWHEAVHAETSTTIDWNGHPALNNVRDRGMADTVTWLLEKRYPGKRVVLWTANLHATRSPDAIETAKTPSGGARSFTGYATMGSLLGASLGKGFVAVAFTAYDGTAGNPPATAFELSPSPEGSLEDLLAKEGSEEAIVDLHAGGVPAVARFFGYNLYRAPWPEVFDGAFFIRTMQPATGSAP